MRARPAWILITTCSILIFATVRSGEPEGAPSDPPNDRIRAVAIAAWNGPEYDSIAAETSADVAASRLRTYGGAPYTELQREGLDSWFDDADSAAWYLRLGSTFNAPWQTGAIRDAREITERHGEARRRARAAEVAGRAVAAWIDLAAVDARRAVRESQYRRIEAALVIQRKRLELGEVSGAEVTQLELVRLRLVNESAMLRAERVAAAETLERLAGVGAPRPVPGDLRRLLGTLVPLDPSSDDVALWLESSPVLAAANLGTERVRLEGERDRKAVYGRPEAELSWERHPTVSLSEPFDSWGFRLRFPLPAGGARKRQAAEAQARNRQAEADLERARRELVARIRSDLERATAAASSLDALRGVESEMDAVERSIGERYRLGAIGYLEFIDGAARLDEVRIQAVDARRTELQARLDLAVLTGIAEFFPLPAARTVADEENLR